MNDDPVRSYKLLPEIRSIRGFSLYLSIALFAAATGILFACILFGLRRSRGVLQIYQQLFADGIFHSIYGTALMGICPVLIPMLLARLIGLKRAAKHRSRSGILWAGTLGGTVLSFLNVTAYLGAEYFYWDTYPYIRMGLLFAVIGASSGFIVASGAWWLAYPAEKIIPRFTLRTLLVLVLIFGGLMLAFQPIR